MKLTLNKMEIKNLVQLSSEEMLTIEGGSQNERKSPGDWLREAWDWVSDKTLEGAAWLITMEGCRVAGSTLNGGNPIAVIGVK